MYGARIKYYRRQKNMVQEQLGELLGVTAVAVSKWERGQSQPDIPTLKRMADIFGVTLDELCAHEPPPVRRFDLNVAVMARAFGRMTEEEQEKMLAVGRALFSHAFPEKED